jgi:fucose 4-O-acetylase-like acetyltransferase
LVTNAAGAGDAVVARFRFLDVAKGAGILLVVLGHNQAVQQHAEAFEAVFSFHMPLFFFFSGVTFRAGLPLAQLAYKRWISLLRPYFVTSLVLALAFFVLKYRLDLAALGTSLLHMLWGTGRVIHWQWLWFLPHLFLVNLCFAALVPWLSPARGAMLVRVLVFGALLVGGVLLARHLWLYPTPWGQLLGLPFSADLLGITLFFFWLGFEFGQHREACLRRAGLAAIVSLAVFVLLHVFTDDTLDLNYRRYDSLVVTTLMALSGIALVMAASELLVRTRAEKTTQVFEYLGRASLVIFIFHVFLQAKSLFVAIEILHLPYWPAHALSFAGGVIAPVVLYEIFRRIRPLRAIYCP